MSKFSKTICLVFTLILVFSVFGIYKAQASAPQFEIMLGDANNSSPSHPGDCAVSTSSWGTSVSGSGDQDCIKIRLTNPASSYTEDFQVCLMIGGVSGCTPWASTGGGWVPSQIKTSSGQFSSAGIWINTRSAPAGETYSNVEGMIVLYYKSSSSSNCGAGGSAWARTSTPDVWGYSVSNDDDPGCAHIALGVTKNSPYNASFVRAEVTGATQTTPNVFTTSPSTSYQANLIMHNTGAPWYSETPGDLVNGDCSTFNPTEAGQTCVETRAFHSNDIVLSRTDTVSPADITAPAEINYRKEITYTYTAIEYTVDPGDEPTGGGGCDTGNNLICPILSLQQPRFSLWGWFISKLFPKVSAQSGTNLVVSITASGSKDIFTDPETDFPFSFTTGATSGQRVLQYKMKKKSGATSGTDANGFFGSTASLTVNVGTTTPSGAITASPNPCNIAPAGSSCTTTLSWNVENPQNPGGSAVTSNIDNSGNPSPNFIVAPPVSTGTADVGTKSGVFIPQAGRTFFIYNNAVLLAEITVTTVTGMSGTLTGPGSCTIALEESDCSVTLSWNTFYPEATSAVTSPYPDPNTTVATGNSGSQSVSIPYSSRVFYLYNNAEQLATKTVTANCGSGQNIRWNGTKCVQDGGWGACSVSCGGGTRTCNNPSPSPSGTTCSGDTSCNTQACSGGPQCSSPANHLNPCVVGVPSAITSGVSSWDWTCIDDSEKNPLPPITCKELKKKPKYIEN